MLAATHPHHSKTTDGVLSATKPLAPYQAITALERVIAEAPFLARCSDNKTATRVRPREYAARYPYMQVNRPGMVAWMIFDLDHEQVMIWQDVLLPEPNLIVQNRENARCQIFYAIEPVCTTTAARNKPIEYMRAIYDAFAVKLKADLAYHSGPVAKTPGHPWWRTREIHKHVFTLGELAGHVELENTTPWPKKIDLVSVSHSRHCLMFERLRHYAYSIVDREREHGSFDEFTRMLDAYAHNNNTFENDGFDQNLPLSSLKSTVKSVARWTWNRYTGDGRCHRGVMRLDRELPLVEKQRLAAARTHQLRNKSTESKIRQACRLIRKNGNALTQAAIGLIAGVTRQTVAAYKHLLAETIQPVVTDIFTGAATRGDNVKFAAHQVTAVLSDFVNVPEKHSLVGPTAVVGPVLDG